jgi:coenzyme PQQ precursor peptide PqqA
MAGGKHCCAAAKGAEVSRRKNSLANFSSGGSLAPEGVKFVPFARRGNQMAWKAPKIVEVPCGMEINMYVSATRK